MLDAGRVDALVAFEDLATGALRLACGWSRTTGRCASWTGRGRRGAGRARRFGLCADSLRGPRDGRAALVSGSGYKTVRVWNPAASGAAIEADRGTTE